MGSPHVTHAFGCLSLTLELPFKDNANDPDEHAGWDGARSARLGAAVREGHRTVESVDPHAADPRYASGRKPT